MIKQTKIPGCLVISHAWHADKRGGFQEIFKSTSFNFEVKQVNTSVSNLNVIRGIHVATFSKLCSSMHGLIFDVVVDLRPDSPTYTQWISEELQPGHNQILVPAGCGHGFMAMNRGSQLLYLQDDVYRGPDQTFRWDSFGIKWPEPIYDKYGEDYPPQYIISDRDANAQPWLATVSG